MNLSLETCDVWTLDAEFTPRQFFAALPRILVDGDVLAFGAYESSSRSLSAFESMRATQGDLGKIYDATFEMNREEHPCGRSFEVAYSADATARLVEMSAWEDGQNDVPLFFDHVLAYRRGVPVLPLFCFHDAFAGSPLYLSGLFSEEAVRVFAAELGVTAVREVNPACKTRTG
jgi:hypothetical protein